MDIKLPEIVAKDKLMSYSGANNHILELKDRMMNGKVKMLTKSQASYIIDNYESTPKIVRRWVDIDEYLSTELMATKFLDRAPSKIWIEKLLVSQDKSYHIWGKILESSNLNSFWVPKGQIIPEDKKDVVIDFTPFNDRPPFEHQKVAVTKLVSNKKYILADDMGLCKTGSAVMATIACKAKKILIICPASLKLNWKREIEFYSDEPVGIVDGKKWQDGKYVIINYDILKNFHKIPKGREDHSLILKEGFDLVIIDEAHYVSN